MGGGVSNISQKQPDNDENDNDAVPLPLTSSLKGRIDTIISLQTTGITAECRNALEAKGIVDVISTANNNQISAILDDIMAAILVKQEYINHEKLTTVTTASGVHHTGSRPVSPSKMRDKEAKKIKKRILERFKYMTSKDDENGSDGKREITVHEFVDIVEQEAFHGELVRRARARFNELDTNKNGTLEGVEIEECVDWMLALEQIDVVNKNQVRVQMMEKIDKNHDFRLNFDEFVLLYEEVQRRVNCLRFARVKFKELDVNQSGTLDGDELLAVVDIMLELEAVAVEDKAYFTEKMMERIAEKMKRYKDHGMSCDEFCQLCEEEMHRLELKYRADLKFQELDPDNKGFVRFETMDPVIDYMLKYCRSGDPEMMAKTKADILNSFDSNGDQRFDKNEFLNLVVSLDFIF